MTHIARSIASAVFGVALLLVPMAAEAMEEGIHIEGAWARPTLGGQGTSAAYMTIANRGPREDALIGASTAAAKRLELHTIVMDGDVARMRPVEAIELPVGQPVSLEPGGFHIMLMGIEGDLARGETLELTLEFRHHEPVTAQAKIAMQPPEGVRGSHSGKAKDADRGSHSGEAEKAADRGSHDGEE